MPETLRWKMIKEGGNLRNLSNSCRGGGSVGTFELKGREGE